MKEFIAAAKALSDPNRLRALMFLRSGELCLCRIIELLGLAPSTVSKHMSILKQAGLVESRKEERWIYYRLPASRTGTGMDKLTGVAIETLAGDATIRNDRDVMKRILKLTPEILRKKQKA